ncbi:MAG: putative lipid II flippase FtsW [Methylotenera sp.]|jgi:cell division protein FtsW|uniref:putative lipid II flippase FtsW n=1 Tax=Methylotenera TaxID=359407 RepID=UPI0003610687|nr:MULTISPECIES: putative lipid II flippase FtsW [Methylotenera]MDP3210271.1 putative lipid II flippase FtsW [Methylotenera sp.]MDP3777461.1 putative lipid II flippase FtsW [Methylotenera sp.]PPC95782.1 MAG: putative lipid II flippase FtsW [Methylotenera sp.]PPC95897.1 MAG: putative lipid II flippase FtsW [Methylotenera sp.]PPD47570.1 MAG: putative lipid II flippase FtsW [Methylotenera sp.]
MITTMLNRDRINSPSYDQSLLWVTLILLGIGLVMVYSASIAIAESDKALGYNSSYYLVRQTIFLIVSLTAGFIAFNVPMAWWQKMAPYLFLLGLALLVLVLIPGIGKVVGGSRRWLSLFVINLQPSEFMKLFAAMYVADYTVRKAAVMDSFTKGFMPMLFVMLLVGGLLLNEPDFGAFAVIAAISISILWLGGINARIFGGLIVLLVVGFVFLIWSSPYRLERVIGFMDPWADPYGKGYQLSHALIAFGRGEWFGVGLGASVEKLLYLPEAHTDFLLAVIAEELGFIGVLTVIGLFVWILMRAFGIAKEAIENERYFSALLAQGLGVWIGVQSIINMGVNMGLLPTKGLTLPLMSFGGSGILANCVALAILLRIDFENRRLQKGLPA